MKTLMLTVFAALCLCMGSGLMAQCGGCGGCGSGTAVKSDATCKKAACADAVKSGEAKEVGTVCEKCDSAAVKTEKKAEKSAEVKAAEAKAAAAKAAQKTAAAKATVKTDTAGKSGCGGCGSDCGGCGEGCGTACGSGKASSCASKKAASAEAVKKAASAEAVKADEAKTCEGCGSKKASN